jgi:hypothetical protein
VAKSLTLLSEVTFGAFLVYSPRGVSAASQRSRDVCYGIKQDRPQIIREAVRELHASFAETGLAEVFGHKATLVPAPRSTPLLPGALWPARRVAEELVSIGLAREVQPMVARTAAVQKSAFSGPGARPTARTHLESLAIDDSLVAAARILVVDDVITKGATTLAVASLIKATFPRSDVRVFAMVRTMSYGELEKVREPVIGVISLGNWGETMRTP